jgi:hypothetical protein
MPVNLLLMSPLIFAFALSSWILFNSLRTMQIGMGMGVVLSRYENPRLFWCVITLQCALIGALLAILYWGLFVHVIRS